MTRRPTIAAVKQAVAAEFRVPLRIMESAAKDNEAVRPRQAAMALAYKLTGHGGPVIGHHFGDRDHSTVWHARVQVAKRRSLDPGLDRRLQAIERRLLGEVEIPPEPIQLGFLHGPLFDLTEGLIA